MAQEHPPSFIPVDWSAPTADPQDRLLARSVNYVAMPHEVRDAAVLLYGVPFDGAVLGRAGAASGPTAIRNAARLLKACSYRGGEIKARVFDFGDVRVPADDVAQAHAEAEHAARLALQLSGVGPGGRAARVIALGGDHSLSYPCALPYLERYGERLAVINLDAHLDVRQAPPGSAFNSGTSFGRLLDKGLKTYTVIGARDFQTSQAYIQRVLSSHGTIITAAEVFDQGARKTAERTLGALPAHIEAIYLSLDIDVADASVASAVSAPTPGGLLAHQLMELIWALSADRRVLACDIMELAPPLEVQNADLTARLAAVCLAELLATAAD